MYYLWQGVAVDKVLAYMLYNLSAAQGSDDAQKERDTILEKLTPKQIAEGQALCAGWQVGHPLPKNTKTRANGR